MALSVFITTLILDGFSVTFSPNSKLKFSVIIEKDNIAIEHIVKLPNETTGNDINNILYETLQKAYEEYNIAIKHAH